MARTPRFEKKRIRVDVLLNPKVLEATDYVAEMCGISRTEIIEAGLCHIFSQFIETVESLGVEVN